MKCPQYETTKTKNMEKSSVVLAAAEPKLLHLKASPEKQPPKPQCPPADVTPVLFNDKENSTSLEHDRTLDECFEDSGYLSLQNSQTDLHHGDEEDEHILGKPTASLPSASTTHREKTVSPNVSPSKCLKRNNPSCPALVTVSTPAERPQRRTALHSLSSTPRDQHSDPNLPILKFQRAVCEELAKSYRKNKK